VILAGTLSSALLAIMAWVVPVGENIRFGFWSYKISEAMTILGRRLLVEPNDQPILIILYLGSAFWFAGAKAARIHTQFISLGLGITALFTAALIVEPFLYAAILVELAVLASVPILITPQYDSRKSILRYLTFQTIGMPFILFSGWMLAGVEANPGDVALAGQAAVIIALGFGLMLGIFPFHTWMPMLAKETHPYAAAFIFYILPVAVCLFGINFLERYTWFYASSWLLVFLRLSGFLLTIFGGFLAFFEKHLGRMMGYAMMIEIGLSLLAISLGVGESQNKPLIAWFFALLLPRGLCLGLWGLSLSTIQSRIRDMESTSVVGIARSLPVASFSLVLAIFALAGFPLTAGFPVHLGLWQNLARQFPLVNYAALLGTAGLMAGGVRTLSLLIGGVKQVNMQSAEEWDQRLLLMIGGFAIVVIGVVPQWFYPTIIRLASVYLRIGS
jgi:formate hydrogenlyase subunit 3/multisubunit Na+/H+ antiporter MnhD subunit